MTVAIYQKHLSFPYFFLYLTIHEKSLSLENKIMFRLLACFFLLLSPTYAQIPSPTEMPPQAVILTKVKEGQKLFALRAQEALAIVKKAEAAIKLAKNNLMRQKKLKEKEFARLQDVEKAEAELQTAEADLTLAKEEFNKTQICAPFSGVVSMKKVSKGALVSPHQELIRLQDIDPIRFVFQLSQKDIGRINVGDHVITKTDAYPDKTFAGTIEAIDPSVNEITRSMTVYATFSNPNQLLIPGLYGQLYPATAVSTQKTPVIPEQALVIQESGPHVYKKTKDKAVLTKVTLGLRTGDQAEIISGLQVGDEIVLEGQDKLFNGTTIIGSYNVHH